MFFTPGAELPATRSTVACAVPSAKCANRVLPGVASAAEANGRPSDVHPEGKAARRDTLRFGTMPVDHQIINAIKLQGSAQCRISRLRLWPSPAALPTFAAPQPLPLRIQLR